MNNQELRVKKMAQGNLSDSFMGYAGGNQNLPYTGETDPAVSFVGNASSFINEDKSGIQYSITITNTGTSAVDRVLALHPGYLTLAAEITNVAGTVAAAIVTDGSVITDAGKEVVCSGKAKPIKQFQSFVNYNPTRFTGLKMLVNNADQFEEGIDVKKLSPFSNLTDKTITPSTYKVSSQLDDKRVEIPLEDFQLDNQTVIIFTLLAGRSVTFTFFAGAIHNSAAQLNTKAIIARGNVQRTF